MKNEVLFSQEVPLNNPETDTQRVPTSEAKAGSVTSVDGNGTKGSPPVPTSDTNPTQRPSSLPKNQSAPFASGSQSPQSPEFTVVLEEETPFGDMVLPKGTIITVRTENGERVLYFTFEQKTVELVEEPVPVVVEFPVSHIALKYRTVHNKLPDLAAVRQNLELHFTRNSSGKYDLPSSDAESTVYQIDNIPSGTYTRGAIAWIAADISEHFQEKLGIAEIYVYPQQDQVSPDGEDLRSGTIFTFEIFVPEVTEITATVRWHHRSKGKLWRWIWEKMKGKKMKADSQEFQESSLPSDDDLVTAAMGDSSLTETDSIPSTATKPSDPEQPPTPTIAGDPNSNVHSKSSLSGDLFDPLWNWRDQRMVRRIVKGSPLQADDTHTTIANRLTLDTYLEKLSQHEGRSVIANVAQNNADTQAQTDVDPTLGIEYLIDLEPAWQGYVSLSNDGTESTGIWRENFGFVHYQLTGMDDVLSLNYVTSAFDQYHYAHAAYEFPMPRSLGWRTRFYGTWSRYDASVFGFPGDAFSGEDYIVGVDTSFPILDTRHTDVFLAAGIKYHQVDTQNFIALLDGQPEFLLPHLSTSAKHIARFGQITGSADFCYNFGESLGMTEADLLTQGRLFTDIDFPLLKWGLGSHIFLEALLDSTATQSFHQLDFSISGQETFGARVVPQYTSVLGGVHTVRGYPQNLIAGDESFLASAEYWYLIGDRIKSQQDPKSIGPHWQQTQCILRAFVDYGSMNHNEPSPFFESDEDLLGVGLGLSLRFWEDTSLSLDWGQALKSVSDVDEGSSRWYVSFHQTF